MHKIVILLVILVFFSKGLHVREEPIENIEIDGGEEEKTIKPEEGDK